MRDRLSKTGSWLMTVLAMLWLGAFPILCDFTYTHMTRSKWEVMLVLTGVTAAVGLIASILRRRIGWRNPAGWLLLGYFVWVALSALFGSWAGHTNNAGELTVWVGSGRYEGLITQLCYLVIFLGMSAAPVRFRPTALAAAAGLTAFGTIVALQYAGQNPLGLFPAGRSVRTNYEFQGTIGNIDMVSGYLSLAVPLLIGGWLTGSGWSSWLMLAAGMVGVLLFLMIEVQSGILALGMLLVLTVGLMLVRPAVRARGLAVLGLTALCFALRRSIGLPWLDGTQDVTFPQPMRMTTLLALTSGAALLCCAIVLAARKRPGAPVPFAAAAAMLAALAAAALVLIAVLPPRGTTGGLYELHELLNGHAEDPFGSWRIGVWRHTLEIARDNPIWGTGPDTFYPVIRSHLAAEGAVLGENFDNPHNLYLAILANNGMPALALYLAGMAGAVICCVRRRTAEATTLAWMIVCFGVQGFFTFQICITAPMMWAAVGMACATENERSKG